MVASKFKQVFLKLSIMGMIANTPIIPGIVFAAVSYSPCFASVLGYFFLPECINTTYLVEASKTYKLVVKLVIIISYCLVCVATVAGGLIDLSIGLMTTSYYLTESICVYMRSVLLL